MQLLPDYQTPEFEVVVLYPHRWHMTAKVRAFLDMLVEALAARAARGRARRADPSSIGRDCASARADRATEAAALEPTATIKGEVSETGKAKVVGRC